MRLESFSGGLHHFGDLFVELDHTAALRQNLILKPLLFQSIGLISVHDPTPSDSMRCVEAFAQIYTANKRRGDMHIKSYASAIASRS
jgi:hypothetical protein